MSEAVSQVPGVLSSGALGRLEYVDPRSVWPHEAHDFTPWLLNNPDLLADALGMDLVLERAEHPVGGFLLDLIGTNESTGERVIVENQLEQSDHLHLGQILTYAAGTEAANIVWVALSFRDEHRAALEWLNSRTDEQTRFFAVTLQVVRVGDSAPAPLLTLEVQPNDWGKTVHAAPGVLSERAESYRDFWSLLLQRIRAEHPSWTRARKPSAANWMSMQSGVSGIGYEVAFTRHGLCCDIYFGDASPEVNLRRFEAFLARQAEFEQAVALPVEWFELPGRKACKIGTYTPGDINTSQDWPVYLEWFLDTHARLRNAVTALGGMEALIDE